MNTSDHPVQWSTSSFGGTPDTTPAELSTLQAHMDRCKRAQGRWLWVQSATEILNGLIAGRLVTTVVILSAAMLMLLVAASWVLQ